MSRDINGSELLSPRIRILLVQILKLLSASRSRPSMKATAFHNRGHKMGAYVTESDSQEYASGFDCILETERLPDAAT